MRFRLILWLIFCFAPSVWGIGGIDSNAFQAAQTIADSTTKIASIQNDKTQNPSTRARAIAVQKQKVDTLTQKYSESPQVQTSAARASLQLGDPQEALTRANSAVTLSKGRADLETEALKTRALVYAAAQDYDKANADAAEALKINPNDDNAKVLYSLTKNRVHAQAPKIEGDKPNPALQELINNSRPSPINRPKGFVSSVNLTKQAETNVKLNDYEEMYAKATSAINALQGNNPKAYMQRSFASLMLGHFKDAVEDADAGLELKPGNAALLGLRAAAYNELGNSKQALEDAQKALDTNPKDAFALLQKGLAREKEGEPDDQYLEDIKNAGELDPNLEKFYTEALARRGHPQAAPAQNPAPFWNYIGIGGASLIFIAVLCVIMFRKPRENKAPKTVVGGSFRLGPLIGRGGMGSVYEAWDLNLERPVAVKRMNEELKGDPAEAAAFIREAKTVAALKHPNIVAIHDAFQEDGETYLVFELVGGETLHDMIARGRGRLSPQEALNFLGPLASALDYAHERRVIHRDLKPGNVMIEKGVVKVMDFGIARRVKSDNLQTRTDRVAGTPAFMAPEQQSGHVSRESDLYSLAICVYYMLSGKLPFEDQTQKLAGTFEPLSRYVPGHPAADAVFTRALAPEAKNRYHSGTEFFAALREALG